MIKKLNLALYLVFGTRSKTAISPNKNPGKIYSYRGLLKIKKYYFFLA